MIQWKLWECNRKCKMKKAQTFCAFFSVCTWRSTPFGLSGRVWNTVRILGSYLRRAALKFLPILKSSCWKLFCDKMFAARKNFCFCNLRFTDTQDVKKWKSAAAYFSYIVLISRQLKIIAAEVAAILFNNAVMTVLYPDIFIK